MPPRNVTVTKRKIKNTATGIDMSVLSHETASAPKLIKNYNVVVITTLPFFKRPEHSTDDAVQFTVSKDYDAFEKLQKDVLDAFPELKLPVLPRRFHLFVSMSDIEERQFAFDCLLKVIAKSKEICTSVPVLRFFEISLLADRNYHKQRREYLQKMEEDKAKETVKDQSVFGARMAEIDQGLFSGNNDADFQSPSEVEADDDLFPVNDTVFEDSGKKRSVKMSLLEESEDLIPVAKSDTESTPIETEDNSELLNVTSDISDVLHIVDDKKKPRPKVPSPLAAPLAVGLFDEPSNTDDLGDMGTDDITKYIQQNQSVDDDLDLF